MLERVAETNPELIQVLYEVSLQGNVTLLQDLLQRDPLLLHRPLGSSSSNTSTCSPLHIACKLGHTVFVSELLHRNPHLLEELDSSDKSSVLHIAVRNGHMELIKHLVSANPSLCFLRDTHGRTPVHVAVVKGQLHVLELLLRVMPAAAKERVGTQSGDTIMHLCVYYNQLDALKLVMTMVGDSGILNATNVEGNTILHAAVANKHLEIVEYLLSDRRLNKNTQNSNGMTAIDVLKDSGLNHNNDGQLRLMLKRENILRTEDMKSKMEREKQFDWMEKQRNTLLVVASLIATMAFQGGLNPPGGVWQDNNTYSLAPDSSAPHTAGSAVLALQNPRRYEFILVYNSVGFVLSMSIILLLISGFPCRRFFMVVIMVLMWLAISSMTFSYAASAYALAYTKNDSNIGGEVAGYSVFVWICLLTLGHIIMWTTRLIKQYWICCRTSRRRNIIEY